MEPSPRARGTTIPVPRHIYLLHPLQRHVLQLMLEWEFQLLRGKPEHQGRPLDQSFGEASDLLSRLAPISRIPEDIQREILLLAIQSTGHSPMHLMQVCRSWHTVIMGIPRLWSSLKLGAWTAHEQVASTLERSKKWPLEVEIDTFDEMKNVNGPHQRYKALAVAIPTMARWGSLKLVNFSANEGEDAITDESRLVSQLDQPLSCLESFIMLDPCPSSPFIRKLLSTISTTSKSHLKTIQVPCPSILSMIAEHSDYAIFDNLRTLKVHIQYTCREPRTTQPLDLLSHLKHVEVLELMSVVLPHYRPDIILPLEQTLRQLTLKATSIQWLFGRTFTNILSCTIISPLHIAHPDYDKVKLPSCKELFYDGHPFNTLRSFLLPMITTFGVKTSEWTKKRADPHLDWILGPTGGLLQGVNVLYIDLISCSEAFLESLAHLLRLQEFTLRMTTPTGLSCGALRRLCAEPLVCSDELDVDHWYRGSMETGEWRAPVWPLLTALRLDFRRWLRDTEKEHEKIVPLFIAIAWTRTNLDDPLQCFEIHVEELMKDKTPLTLVGGSSNPLEAFSLNGMCDYEPSEEALEAVVTSAILRTNEISHDTLRFLSQPPCHSVLRRLRSLELHLCTSAGPRDPIDVLPHFEKLEVLDVHDLQIPSYSPDIDLTLVRTLRRLSLRHTSFGWMMGRRFKRLEECNIWNPVPDNFTEARPVKMPVCTHMVFGDRTLERLKLFYLPSLMKLALVNPWFPDISTFALQWTKGVESISKSMKVMSLQLEVSVCDYALINALWLQPRLEELVLRVWAHDRLEAILTPFVIDDHNVLGFNEDSMEDNGSSDNNGMVGGGTEVTLALCPQLQRLELKLENYNYKQNRSVLLPLCKRILCSRRSKGRPLQSFKLLWKFGEEEEQLVP